MASLHFVFKMVFVATLAGSVLFGSTLGVHAGPLSEPMINKNIVENPSDDSWLSWLHGGLTVGYQTDYLFRGNNETPNAPGVSTEELRLNAQILGGNLALDLFGVQQLGRGSYTVFSPFKKADGSIGVAKYQTIQRSYEKYIPSLAYTYPLGPISVTLGDLVELETLSRDRTGFARGYISPTTSTTLYQVIDRPYLGVDAPRVISESVPALSSFHLDPSLTYYVTASVTHNPLAPEGIDVGYLTARLNSYYEVVQNRVILAPYGLVSASFRDRARIGNSGFNTDFFTGFDAFQTGLEITTKLTKNVDFTVQGSYVRLFDLSPTDQKNTFFNVTKVSIHF